MKKAEVQLTKVYMAKIGNNVVPVRIDRYGTRNGWVGTNLATGREVSIKSAQKLRRVATDRDIERAAQHKSTREASIKASAEMRAQQARVEKAGLEATQACDTMDQTDLADDPDEARDELLDLSKPELVDYIEDLREKVAKLEAELSALRPRSLA